MLRVGQLATVMGPQWALHVPCLKRKHAVEAFTNSCLFKRGCSLNCELESCSFQHTWCSWHVSGFPARAVNNRAIGTYALKNSVLTLVLLTCLSILCLTDPDARIDCSEIACLRMADGSPTCPILKGTIFGFGAVVLFSSELTFYQLTCQQTLDPRMSEVPQNCKLLTLLKTVHNPLVVGHKAQFWQKPMARLKPGAA